MAALDVFMYVCPDRGRWLILCQQINIKKAILKALCLSLHTSWWQLMFKTLSRSRRYIYKVWSHVHWSNCHKLALRVGLRNLNKLYTAVTGFILLPSTDFKCTATMENTETTVYLLVTSYVSKSSPLTDMTWAWTLSSLSTILQHYITISEKQCYTFR